MFVHILGPKGTSYLKYEEVRAYNRSVMPLEGLGCTCATLMKSVSLVSLLLSKENLVNFCRTWNCSL